MTVSRTQGSTVDPQVMPWVGPNRATRARGAVVGPKVYELWLQSLVEGPREAVPRGDAGRMVRPDVGPRGLSVGAPVNQCRGEPVGQG